MTKEEFHSQFVFFCSRVDFRQCDLGVLPTRGIWSRRDDPALLCMYHCGRRIAHLIKLRVLSPVTSAFKSVPKSKFGGSSPHYRNAVMSEICVPVLYIYCELFGRRGSNGMIGAEICLLSSLGVKASPE